MEVKLNENTTLYISKSCQDLYLNLSQEDKDELDSWENRRHSYEDGYCLPRGSVLRDDEEDPEHKDKD